MLQWLGFEASQQHVLGSPEQLYPSCCRLGCGDSALLRPQQAVWARQVQHPAAVAVFGGAPGWTCEHSNKLRGKERAANMFA